MSATLILLLAHIAAYLLELRADEATLSALALWPWHGGFLPWQLLTYAFLHAGPGHLAFNMFGLWMFGRDLERAVGKATLCQVYFASVLAAGLTQLVVVSASASPYATVGASGGVFGILLAFALCFPRRVIVLLLPPVPMPAWLFLLLYVVAELWLGITGSEAGVAHFAHLGGMAGAYAVMWRLRRKVDLD